MVSEQYSKLVRDVALGYTDSELEVRVVVTIRSRGEIVHRVSEYMTNEEDETMLNVLGTALKLSSGELDVVTEE